ncbi:MULTISPECIES: hypothetical protein [unclassified Streptomyces]|uniref:hypothetical protein n=1 Tax=unclassified Streptomyces TaxID=2593676 RepID=UPI00236693CA|nr:MULTISPECIES: hypothetical protein [unclassified Streptomyces]MDF3142133.1 hypothetical protein [Streptomyces sp. T21Q-yed]WDF43586.1 hypothetical protein PBV52_45820 [Streptomyces sp. T12]
MSWMSPLVCCWASCSVSARRRWPDRRRWRQEAVTRLLELRTALYAEYLVAGEETRRDLLRVLRITVAEAAVRRDVRGLLVGNASWSA